MTDTTMTKPEAEKVQPTYVLISPYAFQTNEFIEHVAKIGPLFFVAISLLCMFLFYLLTKDYFWVLFLPQFVFFSLSFIIGCISNSKTFQLFQIVITYILFDYSFYLACLITANFNPNNKICFFLLTCVLRFKHSNVNYWNSTKALAPSKDVVIDCDGRAWYCLLWSYRTVDERKNSTGFNLSSVKPEETQKLEKIQPTRTLISPYAFQRNKFIEFVAKFGPLFFAAIFVTCMILFHLKTNNNFWVLFMPQFVFFSLTFIIGCISNNKTFQSVQIVIMYILIAYSYYLACLTNENFPYNAVIFLSQLFLLTALFLHAIALQIVRKKHYVKDFSTPESVSSLDTEEFYHLLFFIACLILAEPVFQHLALLSPFRIDNHDSYVNELNTAPLNFAATLTILSYDLAVKFQLCSLVLFTCVFQFCHNTVNEWNSTTVSKPKKLTWWNRSGVKPEESQILPPFAELNM